MSKTMKGENKGLVPRLRFPEFREAGEWEPKKLGDKNVSDFVKKRLPLSELALDTYVSTENILPDFGGIAITSKLPPSGSFTAYRKGDILIANIRPYLKKAWVANRNGGASNDVVVIRPKGKDDSVLLPFLLKNEVFIDYVMRGVKMPRGDIALMKEYPLALPGPEEQQKIADCLSSLDALISAQADKLDALKTHKKGLMQQLFPREGETVPRLRFPEFREAGEWEGKKLGKVAKNLDAKRIPITQKDRAKGSIPYIGASGIIDYVEDYIFDDELLCISEDGANLVARTAPIAFSISGKTWVNNHAHVLKFKHFFTQTIVENYLNSISLEDFLTGMAQPKLNRAKLDIIPIPLSELEEEQKKIADCLSSLDALITAQTEKIEALKNHKKGLMQQLFPNPEAL